MGSLRSIGLALSVNRQNAGMRPGRGRGKMGVVGFWWDFPGNPTSVPLKIPLASGCPAGVVPVLSHFRAHFLFLVGLGVELRMRRVAAPWLDAARESGAVAPQSKARCACT